MELAWKQLSCSRNQSAAAAAGPEAEPLSQLARLTLKADTNPHYTYVRSYHYSNPFEL
jgi:hypothetical protein